MRRQISQIRQTSRQGQRPRGRTLWRVLWLKALWLLALLLGSFVAHAMHQPPLFTPTEQAFIAAHPVIRFGNDPDWYPIEHRDEMGRPSGLFAAYLQLIAAQTGLEFSYPALGSWQQVLVGFQRGSVDMIGGIRFDDDRVLGLSSLPILSSEGVIVIRTDALLALSLDSFEGQRLAVVRDSGLVPVVRERYPAIAIQIYDSSEQAMHAVVKGEVDAALELAVVAAPLLRARFAGLLHVSATANIESAINFIVQPQYPELVSIINKVLAGMSNLDHMALQRPWLVELPLPKLRPADLLRLSAPYLAGLLVLLAVFIYWNRLLSRARVAADQANQAKSRFLAVMSHEIRTPLYGVLGNLELLARTRLESRQQQYLGTSRHAATILLQQIDDLLDFARIEAGKLSLQLQAVAVVELAEKVFALVAPRAQEQGLVLRFSLGELPFWTVAADAVRLQQILLNLLSNAVKFTAQGYVRLHLEGRVTEQSSELYLLVEDSGPGISPADQQRLFQPFSQLDNSSARQQGGAGLGLAICHKLTALMGGEISLDSLPGRGSCFQIRVPVKVLTLQPAQEFQGLLVGLSIADPVLQQQVMRYLGWFGACCQTDAAEAPDLWISDAGGVIAGDPATPVVVLAKQHAKPGVLPEALLPGLLLHACEQALGIAGPADLATAEPQVDPQAGKILVVDDHPVNRALIRDQLSALGIACDLAHSGEQALQRLADNHYLLLLTDCHMPGMDGATLAQRVRQGEGLGKAARLPIIGLSADVQPHTVAQALALGMDGYLAKPVSLDDLSVMLSRWLPEVLTQKVPQQPPTDLDSLFADTLAVDIAQLQTALASLDRPRISALAHRIKGAAQYMNKPDIAAAAAGLEGAAADEQPLRLQQLLDKLAAFSPSA